MDDWKDFFFLLNDEKLRIRVYVISKKNSKTQSGKLHVRFQNTHSIAYIELWKRANVKFSRVSLFLECS